MLIRVILGAVDRFVRHGVFYFRVHSRRGFIGGIALCTTELGLDVVDPKEERKKKA